MLRTNKKISSYIYEIVLILFLSTVFIISTEMKGELNAAKNNYFCFLSSLVIITVLVFSIIKNKEVPIDLNED